MYEYIRTVLYLVLAYAYVYLVKPYGIPVGSYGRQRSQRATTLPISYLLLLLCIT